MTCPFAYDDGAYILGALSPAERADYENHLPTCGSCRESVANLAVLPGLLGRLDSSVAAPTATAPLTLMPRLLQAAASGRRAERRRRWWTTGAVTVAAAMVAVSVGIGAHLANQSPVEQSPPSSTEIAMTSMHQAGNRIPIDAAVGIKAAEGGTWVSMRCSYETGYPGTWEVRLVVYPHTGPAEQLSSWMAVAGREVYVTALSHLSPDQVARVELQTADHSTLLWWTPS